MSTWRRDHFNADRHERTIGPVRMTVWRCEDADAFSFAVQAGPSRVVCTHVYAERFATAKLAQLGAEAAAYKWLKESLDLLGDER